jgi:hypothetical protein
MAIVRRLRVRTTHTVVAVALVTSMTGTNASAAPPDPFPTVSRKHEHVRALLENALRYIAPANRMIDPASGYPAEGWNQDPKKGLFLRSFTQLTAIGQLMELLANIAGGYARTPDLSPEQALADLTRLVRSLREDQRNPGLGAQGLLVNFLDLATGKRLGPLASDVEKRAILDAFGPSKGEAIWKALQAKGWIESRNNDREAVIQRSDTYGGEHFDGVLAPFADKATREKLLAILDHRVVMVIFGDNANLSASAAKTIGALLVPAIKDKPEAVALRRELAQFLDDQAAGYARLYDAKEGLFYFGWDATHDRLFGWVDLQGNFVTGHMDYFVNEFRGPTTFVALRYGLPLDAIKNLGFKMKSYRTQDGRELYTLAPWEGSAFQVLGLGLSLGELDHPSWRELLGNVVDIEIDYATRRQLPGFLSESYTGEGTQYTGSVGIPEITVSPRPRITDAASLYTLGVAYSIAPEKVERFLAANWSSIARLLTDHGPWEGYNVTKHQAIEFQTSAHTLSLILGTLGTGSEHMKRYLDAQGFGGQLAALYPTGAKTDLLDPEHQVFAWADKASKIESTREKGSFRVKSDRYQEVGIAFVSTHPEGVNVSGGRLILRYRSTSPIGPVSIALKPPGSASAAASLIPKEIFTRFNTTNGRDEEIQVPLPAMPGLSQIKEVVITFKRAPDGGPIDLSVTRFGVEE